MFSTLFSSAKLVKILFFIFFLIIITASAGCGDNDSNDNNTTSPTSNIGTDGDSLVGTWTESKTGNCAGVTSTYTFSSDGTFTSTSTDSGAESGTWALNGTTLTYKATTNTPSNCLGSSPKGISLNISGTSLNTSSTPNTFTGTMKFLSFTADGNSNFVLKVDNSSSDLSGTFAGYMNGCGGSGNFQTVFNSDSTWSLSDPTASYTGTFAVSGTTITITPGAGGTAGTCWNLSGSSTMDWSNYSIIDGSFTWTKQ